jgi:hypothetical protein
MKVIPKSAEFISMLIFIIGRSNKKITQSKILNMLEHRKK